MVGRSNVGKSSLINAMCRRRNLAKTSSTPGKTRLINFFEVELREPNTRFCLVDLPGYGYAKAGRYVQTAWNEATDRFLLERESLKVIVHLLDSRHDPTELDHQMREWLRNSGRSTITVLTKIDKLSKSKVKQQFQLLKKQLAAPADEVWIACSAVKHEGIDSLIESIARALGWNESPILEHQAEPGVSQEA